MIVIIKEISNAIKMIEVIPAPAHIIIIGPSATLGKLFKIVRYGSNTLARNGNHHRMEAMKVPINVPNKKLIIVSYIVIPM